MTEVEQPQTNGIDIADDENNKSRPADIEADMREMERRKRVEEMLQSRLFREELERIVDSHGREGASGLLQQLSDMVGVPAARVGSVFKSSNCVLPINDIRGVEAMGYAKGEKILRCKMAATFRLLDLYGWTQCLGAQVTARLNEDQELFLVNPSGLLSHEVTASSLNKVDMQGNVVQYGTTNFGINTRHYMLHSAVHAARPDIRCAIYVGCNSVVAVSSLKAGLLPLTQDAAVLGEVALHRYTGALQEPEEREKLIHSLGPLSKVLLLTNHGALCCGETVEEAFYAAYHIVQACETQLKMLPIGLDNLNLIPEEARKAIYDASRKAPEGYETKANQITDNNKDSVRSQSNKWRVGGAEFEALMRMLDNAGFRTGYIYRNPLVKSELPKPRNDVEVPPAVSSLGYLLEEEELYRQGIWKKSLLGKGGDRSRWLNSPNVYQKVEVLETGTQDPKKITKWVADGSPTHSTAVRIENPLQFVPPGTNPKEFKKLQQLIKDNRRADKISAGPQSHILEGVTWDEASRIKDANVSGASDHVVLMGAASKGIIQRGYQHNATVYKAPYAKNPFDSVTDDELNDYKKTIERKRHGDYTDTDFSESEGLSSLQISAPAKLGIRQTEQTEHQVHRIETKQAPKPSQPEVVLSDANIDFISMERVHSGKPPTGRALLTRSVSDQEIVSTSSQYSHPLRIQTDDQEYIQINKLDYLRLLYKAYLNTSKDSVQRFNRNEENYSNPNDSADTADCFYELLQSSNSEELYQEVDSTFIRDQIYSYARTHDLDESKAMSEMDSQRSNFQVLKTQNTFRTVSHYGFLSPKHIRKPVDYHIPSFKSYYKPLSRELSIEELFSSNKYVTLPDECIRIIFKNKIASFKDFKQSMKKKLKFSTVGEADDEVDKENPFKKLLAEGCDDLYDAAPVSYRSCPDLPIRLMRNDDNEKIGSAGSANNKDLFAPPTHSEYSDYGTQSENERLFNRDAHNLCCAPEYGMASQQHVSSLLNQRLNTLKRSQSDRKISLCNITLNINKGKDSTNRYNDLRSQDVRILEDVTNKPRLSTSLPYERERKLLSRTVRNERKKEFTEMWMNHLHSLKAQNGNDENLSDERSSPYADMEFDPMEEEIISKIDENHLDKDDESIFTKIKSVIIERSIKKKKMNSNDELDNLDVSSRFSTSTPKFCKSFRFDEMTRCSGDTSNSSLTNHTFLMDKANEENDLKPVHSTKNHLVSEIMINVNPTGNSPLDVEEAVVKNEKFALKGRKAKRNFIAENIRNASKRQRTFKTNKSSKSANRSQSAPRLHIDDLRLQRHNAIFSPRPFDSEVEIPTFPVSTSTESSESEPGSMDLQKACQDLVDFENSSNKKENDKIVELTESVTELKSVVERCEGQIDCLFLEKMEKEIDEIFNLHNEIHNENVEHKEKFEKKILEDTERLKQLDLDLNNGEHVQNGDHSDAHVSTFSHSSKEDVSTEGSPKKDKKKKKGLRTPSFLKKKKEKKKVEA